MISEVLFYNPRRNPNGTIDMEIDHPVFGRITFTANPDDTEDLGRALFAAASRRITMPS